MLAALVVFAYLAVVLYVGIFAFRRSEGREGFFVANRSLGTVVFLLSLFGSNMTAFAILGSSGLAMRQGIGVYGLMASISGLVIPTSLFLIGTRLWAIGKRFGHITQVQILRDRFEMGHIGTALFLLQAVMLVPYIIIGVMGGGETLEGVSDGAVPYWLGGAIVAAVVMSYVFFGGMRGTAWVNALQTCMFLVVGAIAFLMVARGMGGLGVSTEALIEKYDRAAAAAAAATTQPAAVAATPLNTPRLSDGALLTRDRISFWYYLSYLFIPLSSIMFPHIAIFCLTARKLASFKKTIILYPLCIMAIWAPAVYLGALSGGRDEVIASMAMADARAAAWLKASGDMKAANLPEGLKLDDALSRSHDRQAAALLRDVRAGKFIEPADPHDPRRELRQRLVEIKDPVVKRELRLLANANADGVMLELLNLFTPALLAGILGAAIMACVMASDSQILALSTMFSEDVFAWYGARERWGEQAQVWSARAFVVVLTVAAYLIALAVHQYSNIFELAIQYAFSGYASLAPIMVGALFWKRATAWGVLASTAWVAGCLIGAALLQAGTTGPATPQSPPVPLWHLGDIPILLREYNRISFTELRFLLVLPMFVGSAALMVGVSLATRPPSPATIARYFPAAGWHRPT